MISPPVRIFMVTLGQSLEQRRIFDPCSERSVHHFENEAQVHHDGDFGLHKRVKRADLLCPPCAAYAFDVRRPRGCLALMEVVSPSEQKEIELRWC